MISKLNFAKRWRSSGFMASSRKSNIIKKFNEKPNFSRFCIWNMETIAKHEAPDSKHQFYMTYSLSNSWNGSYRRITSHMDHNDTGNSSQHASL